MMHTTCSVRKHQNKRVKLETGYKGITLPSKEEVASMTFQEYEERVKKTNNISHSLTECQNDYLRECKHLVKNRQYKRASRERLREHSDSPTSKKIASLEVELQTLHSNCVSLMSLNMALTNELSKYRMMDPLMSTLSLGNETGWI